MTGRIGLPRLLDSFHRPRKPVNSCPYCGTTAESISRTGLAGCPLCYEALGEVWRRFGVSSGDFSRADFEGGS